MPIRSTANSPEQVLPRLGPLADAVDHLPNSELSKPSNTGGNSGGRHRRRRRRRATLRQSVRGRRGNQISLGGPASLALYRS